MAGSRAPEIGLVLTVVVEVAPTTVVVETDPIVVVDSTVVLTGVPALELTFFFAVVLATTFFLAATAVSPCIDHVASEAIATTG